jgi:hypothetical protein
VFLQVFQTYVLNVSSVFRCTLQVLHLNVSKEDQVLHILPCARETEWMRVVSARSLAARVAFGLHRSAGGRVCVECSVCVWTGRQHGRSCARTT